ncbi:hypothetical protein KUH03_30885 [Sphingobacterium sp. E70]|uniref:hypothetical protein n=1 Tax=Sphingobacterium sp. E70 TaxID=2853439 RepID=UPI00211CF52F|nr:hypothetical protein [Sphingobacterium sp. E70]ULT23543.1 hypothetical protein KUH03_30885 [Sphingobacterium sp. E70]
MDKHIIPECYVDTNLVETITTTYSGYNHQKGCNNVAKVMMEKLSDDFAVGIIDQDKRQLDYLSEFNEVHVFENLTLYKHKNRLHYFIQINPAVEGFILKAIEEVGLDLEDFNLPKDFEDFRKLSKSIDSKYDKRFKALFRQLHSLGASEILKLSAWIDYLKDNNYQADIDEIRAL